MNLRGCPAPPGRPRSRGHFPAASPGPHPPKGCERTPPTPPAPGPAGPRCRGRGAGPGAPPEPLAGSAQGTDAGRAGQAPPPPPGCALLTPTPAAQDTGDQGLGLWHPPCRHSPGPSRFGHGWRSSPGIAAARCAGPAAALALARTPAGATSGRPRPADDVTLRRAPASGLRPSETLSRAAGGPRRLDADRKASLETNALKFTESAALGVRKRRFELQGGAAYLRSGCGEPCAPRQQETHAWGRRRGGKPRQLTCRWSGPPREARRRGAAPAD